MLEKIKPLEPVGAIDKATELSVVKAEFDKIIARCNELLEAGRTSDGEFVSLKALAVQASSEIAKLGPKVDAYAQTISLLEKNGAGHFISTMPVGKVEPPANMTVAHYNMVVHSADELSYAGQYSVAAYAYGVSKSGQQFGRAYGMAPEWRARLAEFQALNDMLLIVDSIVTMAKGKDWAESFPTRQKRVESYALWPIYNASASVIRKAVSSLNTTETGEGVEWIPTVFSSQLIDLVRAELQVSSLFPTIAMPSATYKLPALLADSIAYKATQNKTVPTDYSTKFKASIFATRNVTLDALKLAARIMSSNEATEDSIIPMVPLILRNIALSIARGKETWYLNGDSAVTHMDENVTDADDARKLGDGLRKLALASATKDFANGPIVYRDWASLQKQQGRYGRPRGNAVIVSTAGHVELSLAVDDNGNNIMLTLKDYGPGAVVFEGEVGQIGGSPVVISDFMYDDLDVNGKYQTAGVHDRTSALRVFRDGHIIGDRREVTVRSSFDLYIETDQMVSVATYRGDFQPLYVQPTEKTQSVGINIKGT